MTIQLKPDSIKHSDEKVFVTSDLHHGHDKPFIYGSRGCSSLEQHDANQIKNWNNTVPMDGFVYSLGDIIFGNNSEDRLLSLLKQLNFSVLFAMPGNHYSGYKQLAEKNPEGLDVDGKRVVWIPNYWEAFINGTPFVFSHYLMPSFNFQNKGGFHCHGHNHCHLYGTELGNIAYKNRIMDVGWDQYKRPISVQEIHKILDNHVSVSLDHH